ncbi:S-adenosyl-L-methionine-dependent methyltransferases superfamily protein [Rhynchospora pubera]|uniref:S-adenosyl-L-methionine-dependent methyltransferases superfamily protein n=1 Tax=Rhynchospora pubera TaxID=906938 RepID=A0AAV8C122_9POAL|nr:S-adenosyl-L-methionine-dependent methyltransferases superfamily protein [Rhynchospora pubera]
MLWASSPNSEFFSFLNKDFFNWNPAEQFDLIFHYTFFCALEPALRSAWAMKVGEILKPEGELITMVFSTLPASIPVSDRNPIFFQNFPVFPDTVISATVSVSGITGIFPVSGRVLKTLLITLIWVITDQKEGPPFKNDVSDYEEVLFPLGFKQIYIEDNELAVNTRKGREKHVRWKRSRNQSNQLSKC